MEYPYGVLHPSDEVAFVTPFHSVAVCVGGNPSCYSGYILASCFIALCLCVAGLSVGFGCRQRQAGRHEEIEFLLSPLELHHPALQLWLGVVDGHPLFAVHEKITHHDIEVSLRPHRLLPRSTFLVASARLRHYLNNKHFFLLPSEYETIPFGNR